jgi:hypothetical protein
LWCGDTVKTFTDMTATAEPDLGLLLYTGPFHTALRAAVRERGLTLDRLRAHLARRGIPVGLSSLSDWQHGRRRPRSAGSLRAVRALEDILGLPQRSLIGLLGEPARPGAPAPARPRDGLDERSGAVAELLDGLPGSREIDFDVVSGHDKSTIDAERRMTRVWSRMVVRARRDGVDRYVLRYFGDAGCAIDRVELGSLENCRLGSVRRHRAGVLVAELLFDKALRAGETWVFEYEVSDQTADVCTDHAHGFRQPGEQFLMEVRFHPAALPVDCHAFAQPGLYDSRHRTADLALSPHHAVHLFATGVSAGLLGVGWAWD